MIEVVSSSVTLMRAEKEIRRMGSLIENFQGSVFDMDLPVNDAQGNVYNVDEVLQHTVFVLLLWVLGKITTEDLLSSDAYTYWQGG